jgi:ATP-dependent Clp protease ATP-binding subunit ClpC
MNERDRFDKFTERARKVLSLAQEEAQRFQHNYIGTEHLLLGLVREEEGVAAQVLRKLGVELNMVRSAVEHIIGRGDRIVLGQIGLTPRAKKVIELAVDEARRMNHHYIGTEHLLLGLVREGEGIAAGVLESLGVRLEKVRRVTLEVLSGGSHGEEVTSPPVPKQAALLVAEGEPALTCSYCGARSPDYFHFCFNCGERLAQG